MSVRGCLGCTLRLCVFYENAILCQGKCVKKPTLTSIFCCRPTGGAWPRRAGSGGAVSRAPIPPSQGVLFFAGSEVLSRPRRFLARRREVLTGPRSPPTIAGAGNGSGPCRSRAVSGSCWPLLRIDLFLAGTSACLSPRFYPHLTGPNGPLLDGVPRIGGALRSLRRSRGPRRGTQSAP